MDALKRTQEDLNKGKNTLEDMLQKLEKEQVSLTFDLYTSMRWNAVAR